MVVEAARGRRRVLQSGVDVTFTTAAEMVQVAEIRITSRGFLLAAGAAIEMYGNYCHRRERGVNVCRIANQEKVNSAGVRPGGQQQRFPLPTSHFPASHFPASVVSGE